MLVTSTVAQVVYYLSYPSLSDPFSSLLASFAMGSTSAIYGHFTGASPVVGVLAGLQILVPGTLAVRSLSSPDVVAGIGLAGSVLQVALALGLGLFLASLVVNPGLRSLEGWVRWWRRRVGRGSRGVSGGSGDGKVVGVVETEKGKIP
ncbi:hypothetical protein HDU76_012319, partial [Blyttiomyces sp. JEL0837]